MNPEETRTGRQTLRLKVVDGRVVGEMVHRPEPGVERVTPLTYLRVITNGLTYGFMNGMRPRGMNLFEGTLKGDTLSGKVRFGGIDFRPPEGMPHKPLSFAFKRVDR